MPRRQEPHRQERLCHTKKPSGAMCDTQRRANLTDAATNLAQLLLRWPKEQRRFWETAAANFRALFSGPDPRSARNLLQDRILERLGRAQADHGLRLDFDRLTCLRIATHARLAVRLDDAADSRNHEFARATLGFLHRELEKLVKEERCGFLRRAGFLGDMRNDLRLAQRLGCHLVFLSS